MRTIGERLAFAREKKGLSPVEAIELTGIKYSTFYQHEADTRSPGKKAQATYAGKYGVTIDWIMRGVGRGPQPGLTVEGRVGAGAIVREDVGQQRRHIESVITFSADCFALEVEGDSMMPLYEAGDLVICQAVSDIRQILRKRAVVTLEDDTRYLKKVLPGDRGRYNLESVNGALIENVRIVRAARILWHKPK